MLRKINILIALTLLIIGGLEAQNHSDKIIANLQKPASNSVLVVSHRADWRNAPENSLQAIQNCIDMGVDVIEIDLKKTKDGHLILMHDKKIDRTTTGKGYPADYTLEEVMSLCKGKILVNIDKGYDYFKDVYAVLKETGTVQQCIIKAGLPYEQVKAENGDVLDKVIFMPIVQLHKDGAEAVIDSYQTHMKPAAYELVFDSDSPEILNLIKKVRNTGSNLFINSLWPELCGGHDDDRAVELHQPDESWGWIIGQGAKLIQTDRPALLLEYLREKKLHD